MEHPNIAKVFDAGATSTGRPYFVMEYVPGIPITAYCDKHCLAIRERLGLFMQVCEGVQHAHQKAIIHRDLKPFNVLGEELDQKPVPKIIDFGLAKARAVRLWLDIKLWQRWEPTKEKPDSTLSWRKEFLKEFAETDARKCPLGSLPVVVISSEPSAPESHFILMTKQPRVSISLAPTTSTSLRLEADTNFIFISRRPLQHDLSAN